MRLPQESVYTVLNSLSIQAPVLAASTPAAASLDVMHITLCFSLDVMHITLCFNVQSVSALGLGGWLLALGMCIMQCSVSTYFTLS